MTEEWPSKNWKKLLGSEIRDQPDQEDDRYRFIRELGRGSMGVVWEAEDLELNRRVAIKVLSSPLIGREEARKRFVREAGAVARLSHPGVASLYDANEDMLVMQLIHGPPLSEARPTEIRVAVRYVRDAALAVHHAHEQGIVHRDIKPSNLMLEGDRVLVTDFGLAKELSVESSLSMSGGILGSPSTMAPEQAEGRTHAIDARTDVYGLGATLYDLIAGRPPFVDSDIYQHLRKIIEQSPPPMGSHRKNIPIPRDLELVVQRCLSKDPDQRYASAQDLANDLTRWLNHEPVFARPLSFSYRLSKFVAKRKALTLTAGLGILGILGALLVLAVERRTARRVAGLVSTVDVRLDDAYMLMATDPEAAIMRRQQGIRACEEYLEDDPSAAYVHFLHGRLLRAAKKYEAAGAALDRALEFDPELTEARFERGLLRAMSVLNPSRALEEKEASRRRTQAIEDLSGSIEGRPESLRHVDIEFGRTLVARLQGNADLARSHLAKVIRINPRHEEAPVIQIGLDLEIGDNESARIWAMREMDIARGFGSMYESSPNASGLTPQSLPYFEAKFSLSRPQNRSARAYVEQAWLRLSKAHDALRLDNRGKAKEELVQCKAHFESALKIEAWSGGYNDCAACTFELGRLDPSLGQEFMVELDRAIAFDERSPWPRINRTLSREESSLPLQTRIQDASIAVGQFPQDPGFLSQRGRLRFALADKTKEPSSRLDLLEEAWADLDLANRLQEDDAITRGALGLVLWALGHRQSAEEHLRFAASSDVKELGEAIEAALNQIGR